MSALRVTARLVAWQLSNALRSRWLLGYALFFLVVTDALLRFAGGGDRALLSLTSLVLLVVPLVATVFGTTWFYDARAFTEVLLAQPVDRRPLFVALYVGLALPITLAFVAGVALPFAVHGVGAPTDRLTLATLLGIGAALTFAFVAVAFLVAVRVEDKVKGLGTAVVVWLALTLLYDGLVLLLTTALGDYPIERPLLGLVLANPVDLARVLLLLRLDAAALMGYTGAVFSDFFGGVAGPLMATSMLLLWIAVPAWLALHTFRRKDF